MRALRAFFLSIPIGLYCLHWATILHLNYFTVQRSSFNVIMTYFFAEGHIYVILNKLAQLSTKDYNSEGTACNQETLRNFWFYKIKIVQSFEAVHIWHKFIVCMKTLIAIFGLMVCLCFPFHSASTKKVMWVCISSIALSPNIQN